jgi:hypothetical protein
VDDDYRHANDTYKRAKVATAWLQGRLRNNGAGRMFVGDHCGLAEAEGWNNHPLTAFTVALGHEWALGEYR